MTSNSEYDHDDRLEEILAGYVLGDLDEAEMTWLNQQLIANPQLQSQIDELTTTLNLMPYGLPPKHPSPNLENSVLTHTQNRSSSGFAFKWGWIVSGVTILSTLWLSWQNYSLKQQIAQINDQLQEQKLVSLLFEPNNRLVSFQSANEVTNSSGSLFISPQSQKAVLALDNLQPLSGQQIYRLWAVSDGKKTGCANFVPDHQGKVYLEISNTALNEASVLLITIEPKSNTKRPLGNVVLTGSYSGI